MSRALLVLAALYAACGCSGAQQAQEKAIAATSLDDLCQLRAMQKELQASQASTEAVLDVFRDAGRRD